MSNDKLEIEIPGYEILRPLGEGGMARVYLAIQKNFEREVALKIMSPTLLTDPSFGERFTREAKINARLIHPNIVPVYDVGVHEKHNYMAMEHLPGGDLKGKIQNGSHPRLAFDVAWQIADALSYAHEKKFVHRDIKPENILFREDNSAVLTDFGIARASDNKATRMTATGVIIGSAHYMSPEQSRAQDLDGRSDLYSLGIVFYEALVGEVPYDADSAVAIALKHVADPVPVLPEPFEFVQPFLSKVLAKNPDDRYDDAAAMRDALDDYIGSDELAALGGEGGFSKRVTQSRRVSESGTLLMPSGPMRSISDSSNETVVVSPADAKTAAFDAEDELPTVIQPAVKVPGGLKNEAASDGADQELSARFDSVRTAVLELLSKQPLAVGGGAFVLVVLLGLLLFGGGEEPTDESSMAPQDAAEVESPRSNDSSQEQFSPFQSRIKDLLGQGESAEEVGDLKLAKEKYNTVLALSADNAAARDGMDRLADNYLNQALAAIDGEGDIAKARSLVDQTLLIAPDHPRIGQVRKKIQALLIESGKREGEQRQRELKLLQILTLAEKALNEERFVMPPGDNSYDFFQQALALDPQNSVALEGLTRLGDIYLTRVEQSLESGDLSSANSMLSAARQIAPDHPKLAQISSTLAGLEREAQQQESQRRAKADAIFRLLTLAEQDILQNRFLLPDGFSAIEKYQEILALDPQNVDARQGIIRIGTHFEQLCRAAIAAKDHEEAEKNLEIVEMLTPDNEAIASLRALLVDLRSSQQEKIDRVNRIKGLLAGIEALLNKDNPPLHVLKDANDKVGAVLKLDPDNTYVPLLRETLIVSTARQANAAVVKRNFQAVEDYSALLKKISPQLPQLSQLQIAISNEKVKIEEERKERLKDDYARVEVLISEANVAIEKDFLSSPEGESALDKLRAVIKIDPDNEDAKKAMGAVIRRYVALASNAINSDKMTLAGSYVSTAEGLFKNYKSQGVAKSTLTGIRSSFNRVLQLTDVTLPLKRLRELNKSLDSQKQYVPADVKEAYEIYLVVVSKEAKHRTVKKAKKLIANAYVELANKALKVKNTERAVAFISRGLKVDPKHRGLKRAKKRIEGGGSSFMDFFRD